MVIVHGTMDRSSSFGRVARRLADLHVVRYDRRGYGRSRPLGAAPLDRHVDDLVAIVADRPAVVFGHSIGGLVALAAAVRCPEAVRAVLAFEPPTPWVPWWPVPSPPPGDAGDEAEAFMLRAVGDRIWQRLPSATRADRRAEGPALRADVASVRTTPGWLPGDVTVPVTVGVGSETTWWHRRAADKLAAGLPHGEFVVVDGAQHGAHLSHPAALAELVRGLADSGRLGSGEVPR